MIGIKVTKPGYNVLVEDDIRNKVFDSEKNVFGHRQTVETVVTTESDGTGTGLITHSFGYVPIVMAWVENYSGTRLLVPQKIRTQWSFDEDLEENFGFQITTTTVLLTVYAHHFETIMGGTDTPLANEPYTFTVILFYNEMSEEA